MFQLSGSVTGRIKKSCAAGLSAFKTNNINSVLWQEGQNVVEEVPGVVVYLSSVVSMWVISMLVEQLKR